MAIDVSYSQDLALALQLQSEELEELKMRRKGKHREGETDDLEVAIQLYETEIAFQSSIVTDRSMCGSIARAVRQDADLIGNIVLEEEQAASDRELAYSLSGHMKPTTAVRRPSTMSAPDDRLLARLETLYISSEEPPAESSAWAATRGGPSTSENGRPMIECISCGEKRHDFDVSRSPCSHNYCRQCLEDLFAASLSDESLFPPRCCGQPLPLDSCRIYISPELVGKFQAKKAELETPNRTYCHQPTCSAFVPTQFILGDVATCPRCQTRTCVICKGAAHEGDCPRDTATQDLLRLAAENGWQRCYSCRRIVEIEHGCNHMTCRCGAHFCYECGARWKTCRCDQWHEDRLYARANAVVDRDDNARQLDQAARTLRVERERQNLMENHECRHNRWRSRGGQHRCEECHNLLPLFIYECVQCRILVCKRCRFNRL